MRRLLPTASVVIALAVVCLATASADAASVRLRVASRPPANLPMELTGEIAAALTTGDGAPASNLSFHVKGPRGGCLAQSLPGERGTTTLAWQAPVAGGYEITIASADRRGAKGVSREENLIAKDDGGMVRINNGVLSTAHIPAVGGGFPVEVAVAGVKTPLKFEFADRLYHPDVGQFFLASNPKPTVRLVANGPLFATVEVSGGYYRLEAGQWVQHIAKPLARYRFTYYRDCPLVRVETTVTQEGAFAWKELHVLELRPIVRTTLPREGGDIASVEQAPPLVPKSWAGGRPTEEGMVTRATGSKTFDRWAAIYFENGVAALLSPHGAGQQARRARFYDGKDLLYLCGPWVEFAGPSAEFGAWLYFGPRNTPRQTLEEVAGHLARRASPRVEVAGIEEQAKTLRQKTVSALPGFGNRTARAVRVWQIQHALADAHALRNVAAARRVLSQKAPPRTLPRETPPAVEVVSLGGGRDAVVTDQLLLAFDAKGRLTSFYQTLSNTELLVRPCSMFRLTVRNPLGVEAVLTAHETERVGAEFANGELRLRYAGTVFGAQTARVDLALRPDGPSVRWSAAASVEGGQAACWRLDFPVLDGLGRLEGDDANDAVMAPDGWGRRIGRPTAAYYQGRYPSGGATMQWIALARDNDTTLGLIARDGRCFAKDFFAAANEDGRSHALEVRHYPENMGSTTSCQFPYEVETVALNGDWFALAQHYRAWATRQAWCEGGKNRRRRDTPEWFRKLVWWHHDGARDGAKLIETFDHLQKAVPFPLAFHWYNWHSIPFDNFYPDYFPANDYVPAVLTKLHKSGVRVMPYINGHLWDTQAKSYAEEGARRWAMKKFDGSLYIEHWNKHDHSTTCPFTDAWRDKMVKVTDRLFREVGVDAVYLDQIGAAAAQLCYDESHAHPRGGGDHYVVGYWKVLAAVRENARRINPDAALTTEDTAEPFIRHLDGMLMCNRAHPDSIPFFPAVYHDHVAQFGLYMYEPEIKAGVTFRSKEAMLFHFGAQLGWHGTSWSEAAEHKAKFAWLAKLAAYRQLGLDWLAYGDMLRPLVVTMRDKKPMPRIAQRWTLYKTERETEQPAVTTSAWQASDGRVAVFVINVSDRPLKVRVRLPADAKNKKVREWEPPAKELSSPDISNHELQLDLGPQCVRMFVAM